MIGKGPLLLQAPPDVNGNRRQLALSPWRARKAGAVRISAAEYRRLVSVTYGADQLNDDDAQALAQHWESEE